MNKKSTAIFAFISFFLISWMAHAESAKPLPTIATKTVGMQKHAGFIPLYWDGREGKMWIEIARWDAEFLYLHSLPHGIGSNDIGLDRGQIGEPRVVKFMRSGPRVLLVQVNESFRATSASSLERAAVEESFAQSVLWGGVIEAEDGETVLVDATSLFLRDAHGVASTLRVQEQGDYELDMARSAFYLPRTKAFPRNTEVEVILTFQSKVRAGTGGPGNWVRDVVPTPESITVHEHHSLIQAPDPGYHMRRLDPRAGIFGIEYLDFGTPVGESLRQQFIARHRLKKKDPSAAVSEAEEPIVYYVDPGAPEPIRSALIEGAQWWNQAFVAAGYRNAFRVELLPEDADPMDVRYNVIQWVHRATRGWSYGNAVMDPRTGEIIKGHVLLGSQRIRQDYLIAEGLLAPYEDGKTVSPEMLNMALARLRQLSAHEVGHTLGFEHNFAASISNRASVMDYPHPLVEIRDDGTVDLSNAYAVGIGEWDKTTVAYAYSDFAPGTDESQELENILQQAFSKGLLFITDPDARPDGSAHPKAHLWDNGTDATAELNHIMEVRRNALNKFSEKTIRSGRPLSSLEETLVPVYFFHRFQTIAAAKILGGVDYTYALRGDGLAFPQKIDPETQRKALAALLETLKPAALMLPPRVVELIPPKASSTQRYRESLPGRSGLTFDSLAPAESAANLTVGLILHPERASRLVEQNSQDSSSPSLSEVIDQLLSQTWKSQHPAGYTGAVQRVVDRVVLFHLMSLASNQSTRGQARAIAFWKLQELQSWMQNEIKAVKDESHKAHLALANAEIGVFLQKPTVVPVPTPQDPPPGAPIGCNWGNE